MIISIFSFLNRPTSRNVIINTIGNYLNVFFTAFFALLLVRIMSPAQYGVLSVLLGIAYVLANLLDFGTTANIYSFLPVLLEKPTAQIHHFIKTTFYYQSLFSAIVIAILFITFPWLDKNFFKTQAPLWELYLTAIMVMFLIWQNTGLNMLFAAKKFLKANIYLNTANFIKTVIIFLVALSGNISTGAILLVFGVVGPVIFFTFLFLEKKPLVLTVLQSEVKKEEFRFGYTLTYFIASQFYNLSLRMDLFLLSYFRTKTEVGYYGLAQKIILTVMSTITSITQVLSPMFSSAKTKKDVLHLFKTSLLYLLLPCGLFVALFILPSQVYDLFFTLKYAQTATIAKMLSLPYILFTLLNIPLLFLLYTVKKPLPILITNIVVFIIITCGNFFLIPIHGVKSPPIIFSIALVFAGIVLSLTSFQYYCQLKTTK